MKRIIISIILISFFVINSIIIGSTAETIKSNMDSDEWTIMVFLDGDNNLEKYAIDDFLEISSVNYADSGVNVVVQLDRTSGYDYRYGNWENTRRGLVVKNDVPSDGTDGNPAWGENIGEVNCGDPQTVIDFVNWAKTNYPAEKYCLILWDHGSGWKSQNFDPRKYVCIDETSGDALFTYELRIALDTISNGGADKINLMGFDACLMGMIEVSYEIKDFCNYMTASEETEPVTGWDYDGALNALVTDSSIDGMQLGDLFVTYFMGSDITLSTIDMSSLSYLAYAASDLADNLQIDSYRNDIQNAIDNVMTFGGYYAVDIVDLYHFAQLIQAYIDDSYIDNLAQAVMSAVLTTVTSEKHSAGYENAHGISIYVPYYDYDSDYEYLLFAQNTQWNEFLFWWFNGGSTSNPPSAPIIMGEKSGQVGVEYSYSFTSEDPDGDDIIYYIQWDGNGAQEQIGPKKSGETATASHSWFSDGFYVIKAQAIDSNNAKSEWATFTVTMPRAKSKIFLEKIIDCFPILYNIFSQFGLIY